TGKPASTPRSGQPSPQEAQRLQIEACESQNPIQTSKLTAVSNNGFEVNLYQAVNSGECVVVEGDPNTGATDNKQAAIVRSIILDFGRLRGYFSLGGAVSQNRSQFSQVDTFVGFTIDALVAGWIVQKNCAVLEDRVIPAKDGKPARTESRLKQGLH